MKPYVKQPKSNEELVALLQSRGLTADAAKLLRILETVGYYRFTGYLYPFKTPNSNTFRPNTTLETAWNIYMFDQHLAPFVECLERQPSFTYTTTFTLLSLCAYCMGIIRPESKWKNRCRDLLKTATPFILRGMGAPADWETLALWQ